MKNLLDTFLDAVAVARNGKRPKITITVEKTAWHKDDSERIFTGFLNADQILSFNPSGLVTHLIIFNENGVKVSLSANKIVDITWEVVEDPWFMTPKRWHKLGKDV